VIVARGDDVRAWRWQDGTGATRPLPPLDALDADWSVLPLLPGVDVTFAVTETGHFAGEVTMRYRCVDGRPASVEVGGRDLRDGTGAWFEFPAPWALEWRAGLRSTPELLAPPATLGGELDVAMLVAGLVGDEWRAALGMGVAEARAVLRHYGAAG
jgi:hypothetical protein